MPLAAAVREHGADLGLAHDGDADRCLAVTSAGDVVDGDVILAILALAAKHRGDLPGDQIVVTVMSNLGLHRSMRRSRHRRRDDPGRRPPRSGADAGDGATIGGEQSGHALLHRIRHDR